MGGYYTGNGEIIFYNMKCIIIPIDFQFSFCDISDLVLLYSCSSFPSCSAENGCFQECSIRRPLSVDVNRWRRLQFSFGSLNASTVFVC
jgi:hypothetical protein